MASIQIKDLSILLVEPSIPQLKVILSYLQKEGVKHIEGVSNGNQALEKLDTYQPDLLISSMYFEDMTATDLLHTIRRSKRFQDIPFMLISSETAFSALDPLRQAGVVAILPKPFNPIDLEKALNATVSYFEKADLATAHYDPGELRVLLVDDSMMARNHIRKVLANMGIKNITQAINGKDAANKFDNHEFDLVVTDYNMPEMDGQALTDHIRKTAGNPYIPILMVTSENNDARLATVAQSGVSAICDKPFEPDNVRQILATILD